MKSESPTVLSAFAGIGGLDCGLEAAGFEVTACIEADRRARESLGRARPGWRLLRGGDIGEVARWLRPEHLGLRVGELGILAGGPPCQPFSKAGQWSAAARRGVEDARISCLSAFIRLAASFQPSIILIENVQGFVRGKQAALPVLGSSLEDINERFGTSYRLDYRIVNSARYGVPQRRERAIVVARRDGKSFVWPRPTHAERPVRAWDALCGVKVSMPPSMRGRYAALLPAVPEGKNYLHFTDRGCSRYKLFGYRTRYWSFLLKLAKAEPAWTLAANPGPSTGPFHWENRPLSKEEMLRLQTFPPDWPVAGTYRDQVLQIGNATPPLLAETFGRAIARQVFGFRYHAPRRYAIRRHPSVPAPERTRPVPRAYRVRHGEYAPHPGEGRGPSASGSR